MTVRRVLASAAGRFCLTLLVLAFSCSQPSESYAAQGATAETEAAEQQAADAKDDGAEADGAEADETKSDEAKSDEADSKEAGNEEKAKNDSSDDKSDDDKSDDDKGSEPKEKTNDAPVKTDEKEKTEEAKSEGNEEKEEPKPAESEETSVEAERTMEVEETPASQVKPKQDTEAAEKPEKEKCIIGSTATLLEKQSGLKFRARIDTGAKSCSLHVEKMEIEDESTKEDVAERMTENIGKVITFVVKNGDGKSHILKRKIAGYVIIKTSNAKEDGKRRYKVPLTFLWKNMEKEVLVTLNNRKHMNYPLLIGRNFLRDDFLVDVSMNSDD